MLIVLATATPNVNAAIKLKKAAKRTATRGERTFVETIVAIAFAESWKPFVKSKKRAINIMIITRRTVPVSTSIVPILMCILRECHP